MKLIGLTCQHCSAPLQVPADAKLSPVRIAERSSQSEKLLPWPTLRDARRDRFPHRANGRADQRFTASL